MLIPIFIPSSSLPLKEKNFVFTNTPRSIAIALAELCHMFDRIYFKFEPNANQETIFLENVKVAAISDAVNFSPVPS